MPKIKIILVSKFTFCHKVLVFSETMEIYLIKKEKRKKKKLTKVQSELQIRGSIEDNSKIIFFNSQ